MSPVQSFEIISVDGLLSQVRALKDRGWRLVQIGATRLPEQVELTYSFDLESRLVNLRVLVPSQAAIVPSISSVYWAAFLYENEIHDLFNVRIEGMAVDFHGNLYQTKVPFPFGSTRPPQAKPAAPAHPPAPASLVNT
jgi:ech hydrogenase subunit D